MGQAFLNSGNPALRAAAEEWSKRHGYEIKTPFVSPDAVKWGGRQ
jgi:hypothetical protein